LALAPFFDRVYSAIGGHLSVSYDDLSDSLRDVNVGICFGPGLADNGLWIAELVTNLLARVYPRIAVIGAPEYLDYLRRIALRINPLIEFCETAPSEFTIGIGEAPAPAGIWPFAIGWVSHLEFSRTVAEGPANPYSSGAAAAFAAAELFRRVFLLTPSAAPFSLSLLTFDSTDGEDSGLPAGNIGEVLFAGLGAVGNAAMWALARDGGRSGRLVALDPQHIEPSNLQRYVLGMYKDAQQGKPKTAIAARTFRSTGIEVEKVALSLEEYTDKHGGLRIPTVCISVDNVPSRRAAQALLPKLILNGWTGNLALGSSWHRFSDERACLACLYHPSSPWCK
jgi:ThiF family